MSTPANVPDHFVQLPNEVLERIIFCIPESRIVVYWAHAKWQRVSQMILLMHISRQSRAVVQEAQFWLKLHFLFESLVL